MTTENWGVWARDLGWGFDSGRPTAHILAVPQLDLLQRSRLNYLIMNVIKEYWDLNPPIEGKYAPDPPMPYRDYVKYIVDQARQRGIRCCFTYIGWGTDSEVNLRLIRNFSGDAADPFSREGRLSTIDDMVRFCKPFSVCPMEEPAALSWFQSLSATEQAAAMLDYNNFLLEAIDRVRAIQPNMNVVVFPYPYPSEGFKIWYADAVARYGQAGLPRSNLTYCASGYPYFPPYDSGSGWQSMYWNAVTPEEFEAAKQRLYDLLVWKWADAPDHLKMLMVAGCSGRYTDRPNADYQVGAVQCLIDAMLWAKAKRHDQVMFDLRSINTGDGTYAILQQDEVSFNNFGKQLVDQNPLTQPPTGQACLLRSATSGTMLAGFLPMIRAFRDRSLPDTLINDYYALSRYVAPKIDRIRRCGLW